MDILDILVAKNQSFTAETAKLTKQAQAAMAKANQVAAKIDEAQDALDAAEAANTRAQEVAAEFDSLKSDVDAAVSDIVDEKIATVASDAAEAKETAAEAITDVEVIDDNTNTAKIKKVRTQKKGIAYLYNVVRNYITTGTNEDGGMTQKAITNALNAQKTELENKIKNIKPSGGGSGNISGDISAEDEGAIVAIDENGNIIPSSITEADVVITQIISGTYNNPEIVGLEADYANKTFTRLQGAKDLTAGNDFDKFTMFGGRKRCIVDAQGNITRFLTNEDTIETVANQRIMVYQPAFYYLRVPLSTTKTANGFKINKEHLYLADKKYAGFTLHPIFRDSNGNALRYVLLPAFESGVYRTSENTFELNDTQNINLQNDCLVSVVNAKPISGQSQEFTIAAATRMAENNGTGWHITDLLFESLNQMLMMVEYGTTNLQSAFNLGITKLTSLTGINYSCNTGSTLALGNSSGQALSTTSIRNGVISTYTEAGKCAISYRGLENPYGNMWRFVGGVSIVNDTITYNDETIDFKLPNKSDWISGFGYDANHNWVYLPIDATNANSSLPVGDYFFASDDTTTEYGYISGGNGISGTNAGIFYTAVNITKDTFHYQHDTARVMFIPTTSTMIDNHNYNTWYNSL